MALCAVDDIPSVILAFVVLETMDISVPHPDGGWVPGLVCCSHSQPHPAAAAVAASAPGLSFRKQYGYGDF